MRTERRTDGSKLVRSIKTMAQWSAICLTAGLLAMGFGRTVGAAAADDAGKMTFETNCAVCHDSDGSGDTPIGMSLEIPDLRSDKVQKLSDEELINIVTNGKDPMPSFKGKLTAEEIKGVVAYVRTFAKKK